MSVTSRDLVEVAREARFHEVLAEALLETARNVATVESLAGQFRLQSEEILLGSDALDDRERGRLRDRYRELSRELLHFDALQASIASKKADELVDELVNLQGRLTMELDLAGVDA